MPPAGVNLDAFSNKFDTTRSSFGPSKEKSRTFSLARKYSARPFS